jgi:hypothetical protein
MKQLIARDGRNLYYVFEDRVIKLTGVSKLSDPSNKLRYGLDPEKLDENGYLVCAETSKKAAIIADTVCAELRNDASVRRRKPVWLDSEITFYQTDPSKKLINQEITVFAACAGEED